jgi:hypothetical protein
MDQSYTPKTDFHTTAIDLLLLGGLLYMPTYWPSYVREKNYTRFLFMGALWLAGVAYFFTLAIPQLREAVHKERDASTGSKALYVLGIVAVLLEFFVFRYARQKLYEHYPAARWIVRGVILLFLFAVFYLYRRVQERFSFFGPQTNASAEWANLQSALPWYYYYPVGQASVSYDKGYAYVQPDYTWPRPPPY